MRVLHFQNLNDGKRKLFHFRGEIGRSWENKWLKYEICSGPALSFNLEPESHKTRFVLGLLWFTIYFSVYGFVIPFITKGRKYGFYTYDWGFWATFGSKPWESGSKDQWYYRINFFPLDFIFGKTIYFSTNLMKSHSPQRFTFRGREYQMDEIYIDRDNWFRSRVPYGLYKKQLLTMRVEIKKPPLRAGKGENSYDCDDDGSFGLSCLYDGPAPEWTNKNSVFAHVCKKYCESAFKDIQKYGCAGGDTEPSDVFTFEFIGEANREKENDAQVTAPEQRQD
jgi:hypothetical protein